MQEEIKQLTARVEELEKRLNALNDYSTIPLELENALIARGFSKLGNLGTGVLYSTGGSVSVVTGVSGSYYVATISGGPVNHFIQLSNGILTTA